MRETRSYNNFQLHSSDVSRFVLEYTRPLQNLSLLETFSWLSRTRLMACTYLLVLNCLFQFASHLNTRKGRRYIHADKVCRFVYRQSRVTFSSLSLSRSIYLSLYQR